MLDDTGTNLARMVCAWGGESVVLSLRRRYMGLDRATLLPQITVDAGFGAVGLEPVDYFEVVGNAIFQAFLLLFVFF